MTPRELRREVVDGEAPVLIDEASVLVILDITPGQLARMVRGGRFENRTMTGGAFLLLGRGRRY